MLCFNIAPKHLDMSLVATKKKTYDFIGTKEPRRLGATH